MRNQTSIVLLFAIFVVLPSSSHAFLCSTWTFYGREWGFCLSGYCVSKFDSRFGNTPVHTCTDTEICGQNLGCIQLDPDHHSITCCCSHSGCVVDANPDFIPASVQFEYRCNTYDTQSRCDDGWHCAGYYYLSLDNQNVPGYGRVCTRINYCANGSKCFKLDYYHGVCCCQYQETCRIPLQFDLKWTGKPQDTPRYQISSRL